MSLHYIALLVTISASCNVMGTTLCTMSEKSLALYRDSYRNFGLGEERSSACWGVGGGGVFSVIFPLKKRVEAASLDCY